MWLGVRLPTGQNFSCCPVPTPTSPSHSADFGCVRFHRTVKRRWSEGGGVKLATYHHHHHWRQQCAQQTPLPQYTFVALVHAKHQSQPSPYFAILLCAQFPVAQISIRLQYIFMYDLTVSQCCHVCKLKHPNTSPQSLRETNATTGRICNYEGHFKWICPALTCTILRRSVRWMEARLHKVFISVPQRNELSAVRSGRLYRSHWTEG
jgi:hypothetical protein